MMPNYKNIECAEKCGPDVLNIMSLKFLPNLITILRILIMPVFVWVLLKEDYLLAMILFWAAGLSDGLDGFIAKRFNLVTRLGTILDPLADKLLMFSGYILLAVLGHIPVWLLLSVAFRDFLLLGGFFIYTSILGPIKVKASLLSKMNTVFQLALIVSVLWQQAGASILQPLTLALIAVVFVTTVASCLHYIWIWGFRRVERDADA
ncbi:MAG: CDP-alcohol phosphatidyltransferase family protein [Gammaproteobacteria bacterium]|nr:MAG: CDP-alcohol phosphatidyltransferase family protein [Gammaproteobacteria bacterium]